MSYKSDLQRIYHEGKLLPFVGAGISMSLEWTIEGEKKRGPSWSELVDKACESMGFTDPDLLRFRGSDLQILEYYRQKSGNDGSQLKNWLVKELIPPEEDLKNSSIHSELASMHNCRTFYTTNFDSFLEDSFGLNGRKNRVIVREEHMNIANEDECEIIKFHGDLNNQDRLVFSEADYEERLKLSTELDYRFISDLLNRTVLFLGYSFRDPNVSYLFRKISNQFKTTKGIKDHKAYIVVKNPSDFEKTLFRSRNIEIIPANTEELTEFTSELINSIKSA